MNTPNKNTSPNQALQKGNRFFARKNYLLAKKEFEKVLRTEPNKALQQKIQLCTEQIAIATRKEAIKRGRKLENKKKYKDALVLFEKAAQQETEVWLEQKIIELREKLALSEVSDLVAGAENSVDVTAKVAAYDQALLLDPNNQALMEKKAGCLVTLERFTEAIALYKGSPPTEDPARYRFGYACARAGYFLQAVEQWTTIHHKTPDLLAQVEALLPLVCREPDANGYGMVYQFLQTFPAAEKSPYIQSYEDYFRSKYIEILWVREAYQEISSVLPAPPKIISLPLLDLYAKLYFKLAEQNIEYLSRAISFWLTAIYNKPLLDTLSARESLGKTFEISVLRDKLLQRLEALVTQYARKGLLSTRLQTFWAIETRVIEKISSLQLTACPLTLFPCTPAFATEFSLSEPLFEFLEKQRKANKDKTEAFFEANAYFSTAGESLIQMELGEEENALALIPKESTNELTVYCRQRVFLGYGMAKIHQGKQQLKRYFSEALPLLQRYPRYVDNIIALAYSEDQLESFTGLAEAMEFLCEHIQHPKFRQATAHTISVKTVQLLNTGLKPATAEKLLQKALTIHPETELARTTLEEVKTVLGMKALSKAFKRQNLAKAADIVHQSQDPRQLQYFFGTMQRWYATVMGWEPEKWLVELRDMYRHCYFVDRTHPQTIEIGQKIQALEKKQ